MGFIFILIIFLLSFVVLILLYKWLFRRGFRKLAVFIPTIIILFTGYEVYISLFPVDSFYREDFEKYSGMKFPPSGNILKKDATYPDQHGKYISMALIQLSSSDYLTLKNNLNGSSLSEVDSTEYPFLVNTSKFINDPTHKKNKDFAIVYRIHITKMFVIGFYKDGKTILFEKGI